MKYPTFELIEAPEGAEPEAIKEIVQANIAILDYEGKIKDMSDDEIDREKSLIDLERARVELDRYKAVVNRDVDEFRFRAGHFTLYDIVDEYSVKYVINDINTWHHSAPQGAPLTLTINSFGGSVTDGFHLCDTLRYVAEEGSRKVTTIGMGVTASMGGVILQAGDERVLTPSAFLMIHEVASFSMGKISAQRDRLQFNDMLYDRIAQVYCERSTMTVEEFKSRFERKDAWFTPEEALELGFIDRIGYK